MSKGHTNQPERALNDQCCNNLDNEVHTVILEYNQKCQMNIQVHAVLNK